jgi:hypothetical protein
MKRKLMIIGQVAIVLFIALSLVQGGGNARPVRTSALAEVIDIKNLDQLKEAFQRDHGAVRLVSLLSPV